MLHKRTFLIVGAAGLILIAAGQVLARPHFYGSTPGRAWAHVFWLGFVLSMGSALAMFTQSIARHRDPDVVRAGKYQLLGISVITGLIGLIAIAYVIGGDRTLTAYDGHARRGMFVLWLLLVLLFTLANVLVMAIRRLKRV